MESAGIGQVVVAKRLPSGIRGFVCFLVDLPCLGVKDTFYRELSPSAFEEHLRAVADEGQSMRPMDVASAKKLVLSQEARLGRRGLRGDLRHGTCEGLCDGRPAVRSLRRSRRGRNLRLRAELRGGLRPRAERHRRATSRRRTPPHSIQRSGRSGHRSHIRPVGGPADRPPQSRIGRTSACARRRTGRDRPRGAGVGRARGLNVGDVTRVARAGPRRTRRGRPEADRSSPDDRARSAFRRAA